MDKNEIKLASMIFFLIGENYSGTKSLYRRVFYLSKEFQKNGFNFPFVISQNKKGYEITLPKKYNGLESFMTSWKRDNRTIVGIKKMLNSDGSRDAQWHSTLTSVELEKILETNFTAEEIIIVRKVAKMTEKDLEGIYPYRGKSKA